MIGRRWDLTRYAHFAHLASHLEDMPQVTRVPIFGTALVMLHVIVVALHTTEYTVMSIGKRLVTRAISSNHGSVAYDPSLL